MEVSTILYWMDASNKELYGGKCDPRQRTKNKNATFHGGFFVSARRLQRPGLSGTGDSLTRRAPVKRLVQ